MTNNQGSCCPDHPEGRAGLDRLDVDVRRAVQPITHDQKLLPGGEFEMGDPFAEGYHSDGETPLHAVDLTPFSIDEAAVTNRQFQRFVAGTEYQTQAEYFGSSAVFHLDFEGDRRDVLGTCGVDWWLDVKGANWRHPSGLGSAASDIPDHPVVHVSHKDAIAYCTWAHRQLPSEAQWEYAARGGLNGARYPWGDTLEPEGVHKANIWQGRFPDRNDALDGWRATAPVKSFQPNGFGLWQMSGNVWEWCADWFNPRYYETSPRLDPTGPEAGKRRVMRGGSYLCHASYCNRYRVSARSSNTPDSAASNIGFRTVSCPNSTEGIEG